MALSVPTPVRPAPLYGNWTPALFKPKNRSIGGIVAEVTIEESGTDDVQITQHPVEQGSPIADHAFKQPSVVNIRAGWSVKGSYDLSAETGVYGLLLSWQAALLPFDVITGKRSYSNMLIERLSVTTDQTTEFALMATITCKQVIIVATQEVEVQSTSANAADHKDASTTAGETQKGEQSGRSVGTDAPSETNTSDYSGTGNTGQGDFPGAVPEPTPTGSGDFPGATTPESNNVSATANKNMTDYTSREKGMDFIEPPAATTPARTGTRLEIDPQAQAQAQALERAQAYQRVAFELTSSAGPTRMPKAVTVGY